MYHQSAHHSHSTQCSHRTQSPQRLHHLQHSPSPHRPQPSSLDTPIQHQQQPVQSRKRPAFADIDSSVFKRRSKGPEAGQQGLPGWPRSLEAATSSIRPGSIADSELRYFDRCPVSQYDPATPPLDSGPADASSGYFQPSTIYKCGMNSRQELQLTQRLLQTTGAEGVHLGMEIDASVPAPEHTHEGVSIRSLSPAPSSPSGSIGDGENLDGVPNQDRWSSEHNVFTSTSPDRCSVDSEVQSRVAEKRIPLGRSSFVMGFRPGCERCRRREKGHFAHFG
ncbi:hypothetical protein EDD21DRAFT_20235 [Dissophora ornata]|nr:hypothetical protein EDD21DRAFT_20235 [Dissophora ornata]